MISLIEIVLEYSEEEKKRLGIPSGAISKGGRWYVGDKYVGRVVKGKFISVSSRIKKPVVTPAKVPPPEKIGSRTGQYLGWDKSTPPQGATVDVISKPTKKDPSFDELRREARKHTYTVMSQSPISTVRSTEQTGRATEIGKPDGFWFGVGSEWIDWTESDMPKWKGDNLYSVEVDEAQCLVIEDELGFREFARTYGTRDGMIDWELVAKDHKGIIFKEYFPQYRMKYRWYYSWDVASGCVWDVSAMKRVEQQPIK